MNRIVEIKQEMQELGLELNQAKKCYKSSRSDEEKEIQIDRIIEIRTITQHLSDERKRLLRDMNKRGNGRRLDRLSERMFGIQF